MWPQEDTGWTSGETEDSETQARDPPHREPSVTWEHLEWGELERVWDVRDIPGSGTSVRDPGLWGTYHLPANVFPASSHRLPEGLPVGPI